MSRRNTKHADIDDATETSLLDIIFSSMEIETLGKNIASPYGDFVNARLSDFLVKAHVPDRTKSDSNALRIAICKRVMAAKLTRQERDKMIATTVYIGLLRGNIREDQIEKTGTEGRDEIRELIKFWGIPTRRNNNDRIRLTPSTLTFTRFIPLLPHIASGFLLKCRANFDGKLPNSYNRSKFPAQNQNFPAAMLHTGFAGLIPTDLLNTDYVALLQCAHLIFCVEFQRIINPGGTKTFVEAFEDQKKYLISAMNGHMSNETRIKHLMKFGLDNVANVQSMIDVVNRGFSVMKIPTQFSIEALPRDGDNIVIMEDEAKLKSLRAEATKTHESEDCAAGTSDSGSATSV